MKYSLLALFAPLSLIGLTTTAAMPEKTKIVDFRPRVTSEVELYIIAAINFSQKLPIYNPNGTIEYYVIPSNDGTNNQIFIEAAQDPSNNRTFNLPTALDCAGARNGTFYLDVGNGRVENANWVLEDQSHQPGHFDPVYKPNEHGAPGGEVDASSTINKVIARMTRFSVAPIAIPQGIYYALFIPPDHGFDPYVTPFEVIALVYEILEAQSRCFKN